MRTGWTRRSEALGMAAAVAAAAGGWGGEPAWELLLEDNSLNGWEIIQFGGEGEAKIKDGVLSLPMGSPFTGVVYTNKPVRMNYELALEARRVSGYDFFCGLTFPVADACCSLILGGWGGGVVGISSFDGLDASENESSSYRSFENGRWYKVRVRVEPKRIQVWLDDERIINVETEGRKIGLRPGDIERCAPLGLATWETTGEIRNLRMRKISPEGK